MRLKLNLLRCYHRSKGYQRLFAVAYNSKAYGEFSDPTQHLGHTECDLRTLSIQRKQDGVVYKIPCECGKVYIGETGRSMHERIKEHDRDIRLARTQSSTVSEHINATGHYPLWDGVKFIDRNPHWYTLVTQSGDKRLTQLSFQTTMTNTFNNINHLISNSASGIIVLLKTIQKY